MLMLVWWLASLLLLHGLHPCLLLLCLFLEVFDELLDRHASFLGIASQLLSHGHDLFRRRPHLPRAGHARWWLRLHHGGSLFERERGGDVAEEVGSLLVFCAISSSSEKLVELFGWTSCSIDDRGGNG